MMTDPARLARAVHLDVKRQGPGYMVSGGQTTHYVPETARTCDCADYRLRAAVCKHRLAILLRQGDPDTLRGLRALVSLPRRRT